MVTVRVAESGHIVAGPVFKDGIWARARRVGQCDVAVVSHFSGQAQDGVQAVYVRPGDSNFLTIAGYDE